MTIEPWNDWDDDNEEDAAQCGWPPDPRVPAEPLESADYPAMADAFLNALPQFFKEIKQ